MLLMVEVHGVVTTMLTASAYASALTVRCDIGAGIRKARLQFQHGSAANHGSWMQNEVMK